MSGSRYAGAYALYLAFGGLILAAGSIGTLIWLAWHLLKTL